MSYLSVMYDEQEKPVTQYPEQLIDHLCSRFTMPDQACVLDTGCGRGDFALAFVNRPEVEYVFAGDKDFESIPEHIKCHKNIICDYAYFDEEDWKNYEKPHHLLTKDNSFDVIFSKSVIEHLKNPEHYLSECLRVLKPGGQFILLTPDWISQHTIFYNDPTHCHPYTVEGVSNSMKMAGFASVKAEKFYQVPIVWKHPIVKVVCRLLQLLIPVHWGIKNHFIRFSIEHMVLGTGTKRG